MVLEEGGSTQLMSMTRNKLASPAAFRPIPAKYRASDSVFRSASKFMSNAAPALVFRFRGCRILATRRGPQYAAPFTFLSLRLPLALPSVAAVGLAKPRWPAVHANGLTLSWPGADARGSPRQPLFAIFGAIRRRDGGWCWHCKPLATACSPRGFRRDVSSRAPMVRRGHRFRRRGGHRLAQDRCVRADLRGLAAGGADQPGPLTAGNALSAPVLPTADLRTAALIQFAASLLLTLPGLRLRGARIVWHRRCSLPRSPSGDRASIFAVGALHTLMRRGCPRVSNMLYLPPVVAVFAEWALFDVSPTLVTLLGVAVTSVGWSIWRYRPRPASEMAS